MNLLPIPVLDGGHIMNLLSRASCAASSPCASRSASSRFGFAVLAALMIVVLYNGRFTNMCGRCGTANSPGCAARAW